MIMDLRVHHLTSAQKRAILDSITDCRIESEMFYIPEGKGNQTIKCGNKTEIITGTEEEMLEKRLEFVERNMGNGTIYRYYGYLCDSALLWIDEAKKRLKQDIEEKTTQLHNLEKH
jgi:hypothetical protein